MVVPLSITAVCFIDVQNAWIPLHRSYIEALKALSREML